MKPEIEAKIAAVESALYELHAALDKPGTLTLGELLDLDEEAIWGRVLQTVRQVSGFTISVRPPKKR